MKDPMRDVGMASMTLKAELHEPRKSQHTIEVRMTDMVRVNRSSLVESSINLVLSKEIFIFMFFGIMPERLSA